MAAKTDEQKHLRCQLAEKDNAVETANRRSREEGGGINMNKSEREREIKELFLARSMIRFASLLHRAKFGRVAVNMSYCIDLTLIRGVYACLCE